VVDKRRTSAPGERVRASLGPFLVAEHILPWTIIPAAEGFLAWRFCWPYVSSFFLLIFYDTCA